VATSYISVICDTGMQNVFTLVGRMNSRTS